MVTTISSKIVTARKNHRCDYCALPIQIGQKYERAFTVADEAYTWKSHVHCQQLVNKIVDFKDSDDGGCSSEAFYYHVAYEWARIYGKSHLGRSFYKMLDEVLIHHNITTANSDINKGGNK